MLCRLSGCKLSSLLLNIKAAASLHVGTDVFVAFAASSRRLSVVAAEMSVLLSPLRNRTASVADP